MTARAAILASVWCVAVAAGAQGSAPAQAQAFALPAAPTFTRDVAPVLYAHCAVCHRDGGPAPFSLVTYAEVRPWARAIRQATAARTMPPWKPAPGHGGPFAGERRMREGEIALLDRWVEQGATAMEHSWTGRLLVAIVYIIAENSFPLPVNKMPRCLCKKSGNSNRRAGFPT